MSFLLTRPDRAGLDSVFGSLFDDVFGNAAPKRYERTIAPATNVVETATAFELSFELPGLTDDAIDVQIDGDQLSVRAERKFVKDDTDGTTYHRLEHRYGTFARTLTLPSGLDTDQIDARFVAGVLTVTVPKSETEKTRRIEIRGA